MHDVSICGGMKALFSCNTTSNNGYLKWSIDGAALVVFTNETTVGKNFSVNGSVFLFTSASIVSGKNVYTSTSTASLNISQMTYVSCSNATHTKTHTVNLEGKLLL